MEEQNKQYKSGDKLEKILDKEINLGYKPITLSKVLNLFDFNSTYKVDNPTSKDSDEFKKGFDKWHLQREYGTDIAIMLKEKTGRDILFDYGLQTIVDQGKPLDFSKENFEFNLKDTTQEYLINKYLGFNEKDKILDSHSTDNLKVKYKVEGDEIKGHLNSEINTQLKTGPKSNDLSDLLDWKHTIEDLKYTSDNITLNEEHKSDLKGLNQMIRKGHNSWAKRLVNKIYDANKTIEKKYAERFKREEEKSEAREKTWEENVEFMDKKWEEIQKKNRKNFGQTQRYIQKPKTYSLNRPRFGEKGWFLGLIGERNPQLFKEEISRFKNEIYNNIISLK